VTATPLTPEQLVYDLKSASSPVIAPNGSAIVYALVELDREKHAPVSHLWMMDPDGANPRQLTTVGTTNSAPAWTPDSRSVAFVSQEEGDAPHTIRLIDVGGGESRVLARHRTPPGGLAWSPDGSRLAYTVGIDPAAPEDAPPPDKDPPPVRVVTTMQYKEDLRGVQNTVRLQVFLLTLDGEAPRQLTSGVRDHADPQWSPDGTKLAIKVVEELLFFQRLGIVDAESGETTLSEATDWMLGMFRWSPAGDFILFSGGEKALAQAEYFRYDVASATAHQLTTGLTFEPDGGFAGFAPPSQPFWLSDGTALVAGVQAGASGLWTIDPMTGATATFLTHEAITSGLKVDAAGRTAVQAYADSTHVGEVVVIDLADRQAHVVTTVNGEVLGAGAIGETKKITVPSDEYQIDAWVTYPPGFDPAQTYPVVLAVHGGPYGHYGAGFHDTAVMLANAGSIVVSSNPRGSTSYGREFAEQVISDWGGGDWRDVQAALDAVLAEPYADETRTGIWGYSYGGFMTAWALGQTDRFQAVVCGAPVFNFESFYGTSDITHFLGPELWGGAPPERLEWMRQHSPSTYIWGATTPTLILHGEADVRCPLGQGEELFAALKTIGVEVEFVRYPGCNHMFPWMGHPVYRVDFHTRARDWFRSHFAAEG
jgi:dipeptidyl aminopeptidase/acylaminoacyl peptidase